MNSSARFLRLALPLAVTLSACIQASSGVGDGAGGSGAAGSTGGGGTTGDGSGGTSGGSQGGTTGGAQGGKTGGGGSTGGGGMVITGGGGRTGVGGAGQGGAPGLGGAMANPDGGSRPDLTGRKALFIVKSTGSLDDGDVLIQQLLEVRGMTVTYGDVSTPAAMASNYNLMILSSGIGSDSSFAVFKDVPIPVIVFGNGLYQTMGFVPNSSSRGSSDDTVPVIMTDISTQVSSDLGNGSSFLLTNAAITSTQYTWGTPGGTAIKIAAVMGAPTEFAVFAYEKGSPMAVGTAAGRRVGVGWKSNAVKALTLQGFKLQDGAFSWTAGAQ